MHFNISIEPIKNRHIALAHESIIFLNFWASFCCLVLLSTVGSGGSFPQIHSPSRSCPHCRPSIYFQSLSRSEVPVLIRISLNLSTMIFGLDKGIYHPKNCRCYPVHGRMFRNIFGPLPLNVSNIHHTPNTHTGCENQIVSIHCQMSHKESKWSWLNFICLLGLEVEPLVTQMKVAYDNHNSIN